MIPNVVHLVHLGGSDLTELNLLCIESMKRRIGGAELVMHVDQVPSGPLWEHISTAVVIEKCNAPETVAGIAISHMAHRTDIVRLQVLLESGGIYLDSDVLVVREFTELLHHPAVMGVEGDGWVLSGKGGLGGSIILAEQESRFLQEWLHGYDPRTSRWSGFRSKGRDQYWSEVSVKYPAFLATLLPDAVHVLDRRKFFSPMWHAEELEHFFEGSFPVDPEAYAHHLWQSNSYVEDLFDKFTLRDIHCFDSTFGQLVRDFFPEANSIPVR